MAVLDKFYTKPVIANKCCNLIQQYFDIKQYHFVEPSAGNGVFLNYIPCYKAFDIAPEREDIECCDFLQTHLTDDNIVFIGNPPFGKKSSMAINFFNHAAQSAIGICFIVPVSFMKWSVQKELNSQFDLVDYFYLPTDSFLDRDKTFTVNTVFQIWIRHDKNPYHSNLRLQKAPPIKHKDFELWQYNATAQSLGTVDMPWDIALFRQGYHDYNQRFVPAQREEIRQRMTGELTGGKQQFFFIKFNSNTAKDIVNTMDFNHLAARNTATPGFGKGDFISYYLELLSTYEQQQ